MTRLIMGGHPIRTAVQRNVTRAAFYLGRIQAQDVTQVNCIESPIFISSGGVDREVIA
jgi:hypothetical protein